MTKPVIPAERSENRDRVPKGTLFPDDDPGSRLRSAGMTGEPKTDLSHPSRRHAT